MSFGGFQSVVGQKYAEADLAVQNVLEVGASRLRATSTNVTKNNGRTKKNDRDADKRVRRAGSGGGSGGGGGGGGQDSGAGSGDHSGGKGTNHYAELMGVHSMNSDPKDPEITFDRHVDEETGEVSWTPREMTSGEGTAVDGRDVERIPPRADRIVITMVDGEPQITYVDTDASDAGPVGGKGRDADAHWEAAAQVQPEGRVVAGSGAVEPGPHLQPPAQTEWSRPLPDGADFAVVEVRGGEPHLVFLDVNGAEVTQVSDSALTDRSALPQKEAQR